MISVEEARQLITKSSVALMPVDRKITKSLHYVLARNVISPSHYPPFDQSAMDGYAIKHADFIQKKKIKIIGESPAGHPFKGRIISGQAVRIFTGAKVPNGTDTVVMQEHVTIEKEYLTIDNPCLSIGSNIRKKSSIIKKGDVVLQKGNMLNPGAIGLLASLGVTMVKVFPKPDISIIVTGNELQASGKPLAEGKIYESNAIALNASLEALNINVLKNFYSKDSEKGTIESINKAIEISDIVLITGGISVGKYDFVWSSMKRIGVENIFYKITQKPGKPLFFGKYKKCLLFGLPGNPAAALSCFYEYVYPALQILQGHSAVFLEKINLPLASDYEKKKGLSYFLKGKVSEGHVNILSGQESNNISSFAFADCLIYLPENRKKIKKEENVEIHLLPYKNICY